MGLISAPNPFSNRGPIEEEQYFCGRTRELREVFALLDKPSSQSVSICGPPNIGKSSLLRHITRASVQSRFLAAPETLLMVTVNFAQLAYYSEIECLQKILWEVQAQLALRGIVLPADFKIDLAMATPSALAAALEKVCRFLRFEQRKKLIFLFDQFEVSCHNPHLSIGFFNTLRSFASSFGVAYVVVTRRELYRLPIYRRGRSSPFFNYFTTLYLGLFQEQEAREMIRRFPEGTGVSLDDEADFILEKAGRFPYFLQSLCWHVWELKANAESIEEGLGEAAFRQFTLRSAGPFEHLWSDLSSEEQAVAEKLVTRARPSELETAALQGLIRKGLVLNGGDGDGELFSDAFRDFVRNEPLGYPSKLGKGVLR